MRSYHEMADVGGFSQIDLVSGAKNLTEYAAVVPGEEVLLLAEYSVDMEILKAIAVAVNAAGGRVTVLSTQPFSPGGFRRDEPSPVVVGAWERADVVISCVWWAEVHTEPLFFSRLPDLGARLVALHQTATAGALVTGARFPAGLFYEIKQRVLDRVDGSEEIRVRTALGTDVTFGEMRFDTDNGPISEAGSWSPFPYGGVNWYPDHTEGVVILEESTVTGVPRSRVVLHFAGNEVTEVSGGPEVEALDAFSPDGYYLRHAFIGLNPKVRLQGAPQFEREKHSGAFYFGMDSKGASDRYGPGFAHCDCQFDTPTIEVDGTLLVEEGFLTVLREESLREAARRYGDPDRLLVPNPYLW